MFQYDKVGPCLRITYGGQPIAFVLPDTSVGILVRAAKNGRAELIAHGRVSRIVESIQEERAVDANGLRALYVRADQLGQHELAVMNEVLAGAAPADRLVRTFERLQANNGQATALAA